ncbi:hypothetical protein EV363DRAFT_1266188 [Boletus edulis]|nr:hypothetical protein EV363DRAFT_1266188 [Boletus edulis]
MFLREKKPARRSRYLYAGGGHLTDELQCCYVRVRVQRDVITYPLPDVALPLPPRPIDAYVECTFVSNIFSSTRKHLVQTAEKTRLPVGTVPITGGAAQSLR